MRGWLANARQALELAADRSDLWPAAAVAWLAYAGWLPLIVSLTPPTGDDVERLGVSLYLSSWFPWNAVALAAGMVLLFASLSLLAATAQIAVLRLARGAAPGGMTRPALTAFAIVIIGSLPVLAALTAALIGAVAVAPAEYLSPELGMPVLLRILGHVVPQLVIALVVLVVMQAVAAVALRTAAGNVVRALTSGAADVARHPLRRLGTSLVVTLIDAALLGGQVALLRVLWAPIGQALGDGLLASPETLLLLVGFVAIWLGLLLVAGALHAAASTWWALELGAAVEPAAAGKRLRPPLATHPPAG